MPNPNSDHSETVKALKELSAKWRTDAQSWEDVAHFRDDPYDDRGHECRVLARVSRKHADDLDSLLVSLSREREATKEETRIGEVVPLGAERATASTNESQP